MKANYSSAFAIGDKACLSLESFGLDKLYGVVNGCMFYGPQRMYRVSLFVNEGPENKPQAFLHQGRPIDGFVFEDLLPVTDQYVPHIGHVGSYESTDNRQMGDAKFIGGQLVEIRFADIAKADPFNIPVLITGVSYVEGKVMYEVSVERDYYTDGRINGGRLVRDTLSNIDSIYIKPLGGWPKAGDDIGAYTLEMSINTDEQTAVPISNDLFDAAYEAHLNGVQCGDNNKDAARNFLAQYIREESAMLSSFRGARTGRSASDKLNESSKPRSDSMCAIDTSKISPVQPWPKDKE